MAYFLLTGTTKSSSEVINCRLGHW